MAFELFGFSFGKKSSDFEDKPKTVVATFAPPVSMDGAGIATGGSYGYAFDMDGANVQSETVLITKYRQLAMIPEVDGAIDDIVNEAITMDNKSTSPVEIVTDDIEGNDRLKKIIHEEFDNILELLDFNNQCYDIFRRWYIDGRLYYHKMVDTNALKKGIVELRYVDPRKIKKYVEIIDEKPNNSKNQEVVYKRSKEYYVYNESGNTRSATTGIKIAPEAITYCHSGLLDESNKIVLSHLHKAIKPANQMKLMEDSLLIYRLARAPERRLFYIDVGNLPKAKAEQYINEMMTKHKSKMVYDASTGEIKDSAKTMTMLEDYWFPRREGSRGTEISTLPGGGNLGEITDVELFKEKLYRSLNVPITRMKSESVFSLGKTSEISRDELKFSKFIHRLRLRFTHLFDDLLFTQLILKGIIRKEEWQEIKNSIGYNFIVDNHFAELKNAEILKGRAEIASILDPFVGKYYSTEWIRKNVLYQTDEDIKQMEQDIKKEQEAQAKIEAATDKEMDQQAAIDDIVPEKDEETIDSPITEEFKALVNSIYEKEED